MQLCCDVDAAEARRAVSLLIPALEAAIAAGESVDFGFMKLRAVSTKPGSFTTGFGSGKPVRTYMVGESKRWWVRINQSWLRRCRPAWSRH